MATNKHFMLSKCIVEMQTQDAQLHVLTNIPDYMTT